MNNYTFVGLASMVVLLSAQNSSIFNRFQQVQWETPYEEWRKSHAQAKCRLFDGPGGLADEEWCYRCVETSGADSFETSFYAFDAAAPACRLEQFRAWQTGAAIGETRREVEAALVAQYGRVDSTNAVGEWGSGFWHDLQHFRDAQGEVYLYRQERRGDPTSVELLARSRRLIEARAEDNKLTQLEEERMAASGTPLDRRLIGDLGAQFAGVGALLAAEPDQTRRELQQQTLEQLLGAAQAAARDRKAELLVAADRIANLLPDTQISDQSNRERTQTIAGYRMSYLYSPLAGGWNYRHDLLDEVWRDYPNTEWGEQAFLLLEGMGWDTSGVCERGSDQFREVITHAEKFLADHASSPRRKEVVLALAQAYETWWSASRAGPDNDYVEASNYREGAEAARRKAISLYEEVAKMAPGTLEAVYARRQLPRLKLGLDTVQRRYFCVYD